MVADVIGIPVRIAPQAQGTTFDAALPTLALIDEAAIDQIAMHHFAEDGRVRCEPDATSMQPYAEIYQTYSAAEKSVASLYR